MNGRHHLKDSKTFTNFLNFLSKNREQYIAIFDLTKIINLFSSLNVDILLSFLMLIYVENN
jgi:hypothetical protein